MARKRNAPRPADREISSALGGASDATSGGGAGSGTPDAETNMRTAGRFTQGDVDKDREKLFPETKTRKRKEQTGEQ